MTYWTISISLLMEYLLHTTMWINFHSFQLDQSIFRRGRNFFCCLDTYPGIDFNSVCEHSGENHSSYFLIPLTMRAWTKRREPCFMSVFQPKEMMGSNMESRVGEICHLDWRPDHNTGSSDLTLTWTKSVYKLSLIFTPITTN